jgi:hypothetical protein
MLQVSGRSSNKETPRLDDYVQETNLARTQGKQIQQIRITASLQQITFAHKQRIDCRKLLPIPSPEYKYYLQSMCSQVHNKVIET